MEKKLQADRTLIAENCLLLRTVYKNHRVSLIHLCLQKRNKAYPSLQLFVHWCDTLGELRSQH